MDSVFVNELEGTPGDSTLKSFGQPVFVPARLGSECTKLQFILFMIPSFFNALKVITNKVSFQTNTKK